MPLKTDHLLELAGKRVARLAAALAAETKVRDALILERRKQGATLRQIGLEAGLSPMAVRKAIERVPSL